MKVIFPTKDELFYFKKLIQGHHRFSGNSTVTPTEFSITLPFLPSSLLVQCFVRIYVLFYLREKIEQIIRHVYHYSNQSEIERIVEWTHHLLDERSFIKAHFNAHSLYHYLYVLLLEHFKSLEKVTEIYFDTVILFRFKTFHNCLIDIVGYAIDELKREEEYQSYLQSMRNYVQRRNGHLPILHLLQGNPFRYFNELGEPMMTDYLIAKMHESPLYLFGLDVTELNIAPTLALLPKKLFIYGEDENDGKTTTLLTIFEERATFLPLKKFPFVQSIEFFK